MNLYTRIQAILKTIDDDDGCVLSEKEHYHILLCLSAALQQMAWNMIHDDIDLDRTLKSVNISTDWVIRAEKSLRETGL